MRVLLHTPLKPPDSPTPSGDREMARGLARLLRRLGHKVVMPALSRAEPGVPAPSAHLGLERRARRQAARLIAHWRALPAGHPERFDLWFTYHCYYRKPDWLGPLVVTVNPRDVAGVKARLRPGAHQRRLPPFIDTAPFVVSPARPASDPPLLLSVGMMRTRDKLDSYRVLAEALARLGDRPWRAVLVGDGPARAEVEALMAPLGERVRFAGAVPHEKLPGFYAAADLYLWPAINEAYGMAFLEAQAAGLAVVAGCTGGVPAVVADGVTGLLTPVGDAQAFAAAVARLLDAPAERARLAAAARARIATHHDERAATRALAAALRALP